MSERNGPGLIVIGVPFDSSDKVIVEQGDDNDIEHTKRQARALVSGPNLIPSKKTEPVLSGKAEPLGPAEVVWMARRAPMTQLGTRVRAWSGGNVGMWREVVTTGRSRVRARVRRRRSSVGLPPNWSVQTRVLSTTGCPLAQSKLVK